MCGIFGLISRGKVSCNKAQANRLLNNFYKFSETRGKEASGGCLLLDNNIDIVKAPVRGNKFLSLPQSKRIADGFEISLQKGLPFVFMGHTRMVTNGSDDIHGNNQPVLKGKFVAIHNGIIVNEEAIWAEIDKVERKLEVDTEAFLASIEQSIVSDFGLADATARAMKKIKGANSFAVLSTEYDDLILTTSNGSMFLAEDKKNDLFVFASERNILEKIIQNSLKRISSFDISDVEQIKPNNIVNISLNKPEFTFSNYFEGQFKIDNVKRTSARICKDHPTKSLKRKKNNAFSSLGKIEKLIKINWEKIYALKRCTRCVLPETFPFINFDMNGVCNFCRAYEPIELKGISNFRKALKITSNDTDEHRVLFPLSGGRDSCLGLHKLVKNYNIKPVAYTYDWGMVTDLARRNISRMCGELGIEHILISADIRKKREHVRKNVLAWIKKPNLGTVPIFMAGDKQFFYFANFLKKEMNLENILFSMNPLERTDFKVGFCGIDESYKKERHYDPKLVNKFRLANFYLRQFLKNPEFFNSSLMDTVFAYFSYYLIPKDYISIYDFVSWDEKEVDEILIREYEWEKSNDTESSWRIGDGTAAFYNYIYLKIAGFSEIDTFRSNQIREGRISRQEALSLTYKDNMPRGASIDWYFQKIDVDASEVLRVINKETTLYS